VRTAWGRQAACTQIVSDKLFPVDLTRTHNSANIAAAFEWGFEVPALRWLLGLCVLLAFLSPTLAFADYPRSQKWFNGLSDWERRGIQTNLILSGFYTGFADGRFGRNTYEALLAFERRHSIFGNGILSQFEAARLVQVAQQWRDAMQFRDARVPKAGALLPIPYALVGRQADTDRGAIWEGNSGVRIEAAAYGLNDVSLELLYAAMSEPRVSPGITYRSTKNNFFVISGEDSGVKYYHLFERTPYALSGFSVFWNSSADGAGSRVAIYLASKASYFAPAAPPPPLVGNTETAQVSAAPVAKTKPRRSSGSGFFVSATGLILTNHHVVDNCSSINVPRFGKAEILRSDAKRDLAAILVDRPADTQPTATFEGNSPPLGGTVVVGGFPLADLFASDFAVAFGSVTARRGVGGDETQFSISAPVQPGNSGGPVVNEHGRIVGITVGKLNDAKMMEHVGTTGANFGFAIDAAKAREFLRPFIIQERKHPLLSAGHQERYDNEKLATVLESFSVQIVCDLNSN